MIFSIKKPLTKRSAAGLGLGAKTYGASENPADLNEIPVPTR